MRSLVKIVLSASAGLLSATTIGPIASAATHSANTVSPLTVNVSRSNYGINVFSYDSQMNSPSTITGMSQLGLGMQQFPNANEWSWTTNTFRSGGTAPVSLLDWGHILQTTQNQGLFIFNYDENPTFTGGGTPADAAQLTRYIMQHHLPITAIVVGSEEYGAWDHYANLNPSFSSLYYAKQTAKIAQAIHRVDPNMKVGASFDLGQQPHDLRWDQTVLRLDGPYINFVSIHDYPNAQTLSNSGLLAALPGEVSQAMSFVHREITTNVPAQYARNIQTWVTEYNPYGQPGQQSTQPVYGAAMAESAMLWRAEGASKLFVWSYDGQAHAASTAWPVDTTAGSSYGLFALAGNGQSPELPANTLYPSGQSLAQYMQAIGSGGKLSVWVGPQDVIGQVTSPAGTHVFSINTSNSAQSIGLSSTAVNVPAASMQVSSGQRITAAGISQLPGVQSAATVAGAISTPILYQSTLPTVQGVVHGYPGQTVTLSGSGFGSQGTNSSVIISQNGSNYGGPGDSYGVAIKQWTPTSISFVIPNGSSGPALTTSPATMIVETNNQLISPSVSLHVTAAPVLTVSSLSSTVYPGSTLVIKGQNFGAAQGSGYVQFSQNGVNYGAPQNAYKVSVTSWSSTLVESKVPDGASGPALQPGAATVQIVSGSGIKSQPLNIIVTAPPRVPVRLSTSGSVTPGEWITISSLSPSAFGSSQGSGYILVNQNDVNYGAPGNWYGLTIRSWTNSAITFQVPMSGPSSTGHNEPSLAPGQATLEVFMNNGQQSTPINFMVR